MDVHALETELHEWQARYAAAVGELERVEAIVRRAGPDEVAALRETLDDKRGEVRGLRGGIVDAMRRLSTARREVAMRR